MANKALQFASNADLFAFASLTLGLPVSAQTPRKDLIAQISAAGYTTVPAQEDAASASSPAAPAAAPATQMTASAAEPFDSMAQDLTPEQRKRRDAQIVNLIISKQTGVPGGDEDVPMIVNGSLMLLPRGKPIDVRWPYFYALTKAVQEIFEPMPDGGIPSKGNEVPLYPFSVNSIRQG
jgi:hypothetical protein